MAYNIAGRINKMLIHLKDAYDDADALKLLAHETGNFRMHQEGAWYGLHIGEMIQRGEALLENAGPVYKTERVPRKPKGAEKPWNYQLF
jgi:hypothetical protein